MRINALREPEKVLEASAPASFVLVRRPTAGAIAAVNERDARVSDEILVRVRVSA